MYLPRPENRRRKTIPQEIKDNAVRRIQAGEITGMAMAEELGVTRQAVSLWVKMARENPGKKPRSRGRPKLTFMNPGDEARIRRIVESTRPEKLGYKSKKKGKWDPGSLKNLIHREIGVKYTLKFLFEYMERWGLKEKKRGPWDLPDDFVNTTPSRVELEYEDPLAFPKRGRPSKRDMAVREDPLARYQAKLVPESEFPQKKEKPASAIPDSVIPVEAKDLPLKPPAPSPPEIDVSPDNLNKIDYRKEIDIARKMMVAAHLEEKASEDDPEANEPYRGKHAKQRNLPFQKKKTRKKNKSKAKASRKKKKKK